MREDMKAVIIGAGRMAEAVLYDFATHPVFDEVTVADVDAARAEELARARGGGLARAAAVDAGDEDDVGKLVAGHDVCVSAAPYRYNLTLARAAIAAGAHFVDMGGNNDVVAAELALNGRAKAAGVAVVPDMGLAPGMTNVLAAALISAFDDVRDVHIRVGGLPREPKPPFGYSLVFSVYGLINEYAEPCLILEDGEIATVPPLTDVEDVEFPSLGRLEAFHTSGGSSIKRSGIRAIAPRSSPSSTSAWRARKKSRSPARESNPATCSPSASPRSYPKAKTTSCSYVAGPRVRPATRRRPRRSSWSTTPTPPPA
jgi:lysine 6-dehydrogenase